MRWMILPVQSGPDGEVARVWVPPARTLEGIIYNTSGSDPVGRKLESWGLTSRVRALGTVASLDVYVWVTWVKQGEAPLGLDELTVAEAKAFEVFRTLIGVLRYELSRFAR